MPVSLTKLTPDTRYLDTGEAMKRKAKTYTISAVADQYMFESQTIQNVEREGLLKPSRSEATRVSNMIRP